MSDIDEGAALELDEEPEGRRSLFKWGLIAFAVVALLGAGGGAWYFFLGGRGAPKAVEVPLPYFLDLKPFVVSIPSNAGTPQFVQLGVSLQLPGASAGEMINALLPEVQDAMRETLLSFKSDDLKNTDGVNKVRGAMTKHLNDILGGVLGSERMTKLTAGSPNGALVQNIMFPTLIVE
jgi:flagellar protein FliL